MKKHALALAVVLLTAVWAAPLHAQSDTPDAGGVDDATAVVKKKKKKRKKRTRDGHATKLGSWDARVESDAEAGAGVLSGYQSLRESAAFVRVDGSVSGEIERDVWRIRVPVDVSHRQTPGASLSESQVRTDLEARYRRSPRLRATAEVGIAAVWRPDWPDLYQPLAGGGYVGTDRRSHWDRKVGMGVAGIPMRHHHASAKYEYRLADYREDPNFDAIDAPTHLVPGDHAKHSIDLSWRYLGKGWKAGASADISFSNYFFAFSRDAGTGQTHAGPGGPPPNPLQRYRNIEPAISGERELMGGALELGASYGYEIVIDPYEGYYSYTGHHPEVEVSWKLDSKKTLTAGAELFWRRYGPDSYAAGGNHPPLAYGDRRVDRKGKMDVSLRWKLARHWTASASADLTIRRTNFPAYEPGVFPAGRDYDIDWNYENWITFVGMEYRQ